ncbi:MAG: hypothetical protein ACXADY_23980 [Candidatus Hodarchaeales archaeon]
MFESKEMIIGTDFMALPEVSREGDICYICFLEPVTFKEEFPDKSDQLILFFPFTKEGEWYMSSFCGKPDETMAEFCEMPDFPRVHFDMDFGQFKSYFR